VEGFTTLRELPATCRYAPTANVFAILLPYWLVSVPSNAVIRSSDCSLIRYRPFHDRPRSSLVMRYVREPTNNVARKAQPLHRWIRGFPLAHCVGRLLKWVTDEILSPSYVYHNTGKSDRHSLEQCQKCIKLWCKPGSHVWVMFPYTDIASLD
jgi:hypothetical protein